MTEKLLVQRHDDGVWVLTLNDPERRNAIGPEMQTELISRVGEIGADSDARALIVTGAGMAFCAGADLPAIFGVPDRPVDQIRGMLRAYYDCFLRILELPFPTIAAVHGAAVGAGLNLALCCDIRLAGPRAKFGATFSRIGLHPGGGCSFFLVRAMGPQRTMRILLEGKTLDAPSALENRLVDEVTNQPVEDALALASHIAGLSAQLAQDIKRSVRLAADDGFEAALEFEAWAQASSATKPEIQETVARFRRSP